jgi:hypothetical protein
MYICILLKVKSLLNLEVREGTVKELRSARLEQGGKGRWTDESSWEWTDSEETRERDRETPLSNAGGKLMDSI